MRHTHRPHDAAARQQIGSGMGGRGRRGYTLVEVAVALGLLSIVLASAAAVLLTQQRFYARNADVASTRGAARVAAELLTAELRGASAASGDLYGIGPDSVALRSTTGIGVICGGSARALFLRRVAGVFGELETDSAIVFVENRADTAVDDSLAVVRISESRLGSSAPCPDGLAADIALTVDREIEGAAVGSPVRAFRPYVYRLYQGSDRMWWLGQRLRDGRLQPITGPLAPPARGGLRLEFLSESGSAVADPEQVVSVRVAVRAQGRIPYPWRGVRAVYYDTVSTGVTLRGF